MATSYTQGIIPTGGRPRKLRAARASTRGRASAGMFPYNVRRGTAGALPAGIGSPGAGGNTVAMQSSLGLGTRTKRDAGRRFQDYLPGIADPGLGVSAAVTAGVAPSRRASLPTFLAQGNLVQEEAKDDFLNSIQGRKATEARRLTQRNAAAVAGMPRTGRQMGIGGLGASDAVMSTARPSPFVASQAGLGARSASVVQEEAEQAKYNSFMDLLRQSSAPASATQAERVDLASQRGLTPGMGALGESFGGVPLTSDRLAGGHELGGRLSFSQWTAAQKQRRNDLEAGIVANDVGPWRGPGKSPGERGPNNLQRHAAFLGGMDEEQRAKYDASQERLSPKSFINSIINRRRIARAGGQPMTQEQAGMEERFAREEETPDDRMARARQRGTLPEFLQERAQDKQMAAMQEESATQREFDERANKVNYLSGIVSAPPDAGVTRTQRTKASRQLDELMGGEAQAAPTTLEGRVRRQFEDAGNDDALDALDEAIATQDATALARYMLILGVNREVGDKLVQQLTGRPDATMASPSAPGLFSGNFFGGARSSRVTTATRRPPTTAPAGDW